VWFGVLGPLDVRDADGAPVAVGGSRARGLLVLLALDAGRVVPVARLIDAQYGDAPPDGAANAVQAQVSRLRRVLPAGTVAYEGGGYRLDADPDDVDAHRFVRLATEGHRLLEAGRPDHAVATLTEALALWRGPALADLPAYEDAAAATRLDELRLTATEDLAEAKLARGDDQVPELRRLVAAHPLRERPAGQLMRALHAAGRRAEALTVYAETCGALADHLGTDPSPELSAVHQDILRATEAPGMSPVSLPTQLTTFIGREPELARLLSDPSRLLTITGPGGIGKTRLALEAAARIQARSGRRGTAQADAQGPAESGPWREAQGGPYGRARARPYGQAWGGTRDEAQDGTSGTAEQSGPHRVPGDAQDPAESGSWREARGGTWGAAEQSGAGRLAGGARGEAPYGRASEVCLVDLSAVGAEQVVQIVAAAAGVRDGGYRDRPVDPVERVVAALRGRDVLLVVDNCEHVIDAAARLVRDVLAAGPGVRVLATSREPLGITGEALVPLAPLDAPDPGAGDVPDSPAVRLFADRAAAVRPGFALDDATLPAVARICAALDGLPLAIELAAARLRAFGLDDLAERLAAHERFTLLDRGDRTAATRHRTLRGVVEWSWDLLSPAERTVARRFAAFTGGATLTAVEAICGADTAGVATVAAVLADLVDKSLVETDGHRYRMLDTIRLFCAEKLAASGEERDVRARHAAYFLDLARRADPHLRRAEQLEWLATLAADHGNLMAALRWSADHAPETGLRLVAALAAYWWLGGRRAEAGEPAARLLGHAVDGPHEAYLMCVVHAVPRAAPEHWARGREIVRTMDGPLHYPFALALWGMAAGPPDGPARDAGRVLSPDPWSRALGRMSEALITWFDGVPATTGPALESVLAEFRAVGERWGMAQCLDWLAVLASWRGEWTRADSLWAEALTLLAELGAIGETVDVLTHRAQARLRYTSGPPEEARRTEEPAGTPRTDGPSGRPAVGPGQAEPARSLADDPRRDDEPARTTGAGPGGLRSEAVRAAADDLRRAEELARTAGLGESPAVLFALGEVDRAAGDLVAARRRYDALLGALDTAEDWLGMRPRVLLALARLAEAAGDPDLGRDHYAAAITESLRAPGSPTPRDLITPAEAKAALLLLDSGTSQAADAARAARLLGAVVGLRGTEIAGDRDIARVAAGARGLLGGDAYVVAYRRGTRMSRADIRAELG